MNKRKKAKNTYKRNEHLVHHELLSTIIRNLKKVIPLNIIMLIIFSTTFYPPILLSYDLSFTILMCLFLCVIFPNMLNGKIVGYYRNSYSKLVLFDLTMPFTLGAAIRGFVMFMYHIISTAICLKNSKPVNEQVNWLFNSFNIKGISIAVFVIVVLMYYLFYMDRYVTIEKWSVSILELCKSVNSFNSEKIEYLRKELKERNGYTSQIDSINKSLRNTLIQSNEMMDEYIGINNRNEKNLNQNNFERRRTRK